MNEKELEQLVIKELRKVFQTRSIDILDLLVQEKCVKEQINALQSIDSIIEELNYLKENIIRNEKIKVMKMFGF